MDEKRYKKLKYICNKCGAYNHKNQGTCGICMFIYIRKATKREIEDILILFENLGKNYI